MVKTVHVAGRCNLLLSNQKKKMLKQMSELSQIQEMLAVKDAQLKSMQTEANLLEVEVQKASERLNSISELIENYAVTVLLVEW
jgi:predicted  nucleic acid-binding Zn-ribbon protein